jgi:uncharacterized protein YkwD
MSTRTPARRRGPDPWPPHSSGDPDRYSPGGDRDPQAAGPADAPPWAEYDADRTDSGSALLTGTLDRNPSVWTADTDPGSTLLADDLDHGLPVRTGDLGRGPAGRNSDLTRGLEVRIADIPPRSRRRGRQSPPSRPRRGGGLPPRSPGGDADLPPRRPRRARYLAALLLLLPLAGAGSYYLVSANSPAAPTASGTLTDRSAPAACAPAAPQAAAGSTASAALAGAVGPAVQAAQAAAPCAGQPFGAVTARPSVPRFLHPTPSRAHSRHSGGPSSSPSSSAPSSSSPSSSSPSSSTPPSSSAPSSPGRSSSPTSSPPSASSSPSASSPAGATSSDAAAQVLALINQARASAGLAPLTVTAGLDSSASTHNATMASGCGLSHQCPGEADLGARETAAGVHWTAAGENIGEGGPVANSTSAIAQMAVGLTQSMLNEQPPNDGHRLNILSTSFTHIGIAVFRDSSGTVWLTQDFSN